MMEEVGKLVKQAEVTMQAVVEAIASGYIYKMQM